MGVTVRLWRVKPCTRLSGCILYFLSQNITILYILWQRPFLQIFLSLLVFWVTKAKSGLFPVWSIHAPRAISVQLWHGFEQNLSQKELNWKLELLQCPLRALDPRQLQGRQRRTRPRSPPSSTSLWSGGTSWGWTAPPPCCPLCAFCAPPAKEILFRNGQKLGIIFVIGKTTTHPPSKKMH